MGEIGNDVLYGNTQNDFIHGGDGSDTLFGSDKYADTLMGGLSTDKCNRDGLDVGFECEA